MSVKFELENKTKRLIPKRTRISLSTEGKYLKT